MLEVFVVMMLCKKNARNAQLRGRSGGIATLYTVLLWIFFEIGGAVLALTYARNVRNGDSFVIIFIILACAALGGLLSWLWAKRGRPLVPDGRLGMEAAMAEGAMPLAVPGFVTVVREQGAAFQKIPFTLQLNHVPVGPLADGNYMTLPVYWRQNMLTMVDNAGTLRGKPLFFDGVEGGVVEVHFVGGAFVPEATRVYPAAYQQPAPVLGQPAWQPPAAPGQ